MNNKLSISFIMKHIQGEYFGEDLILKNCNFLERIKDNEISFYTGQNFEKVRKVCSKKNVVVCSKELPQEFFDHGNFIITENPRYIFALIASMFCNKPEENKIGKNFTTGVNCSIKNAVIGDNVTIHSGVRIGEDGFGYVKQYPDSIPIKFPHFGKVIIENNVEIHSNACIDRGVLSDTIIHKNVKIDNLVHIAHNVEIGENTMIMAGTIIGGSTKIGKNCWISPGCKIIDNVTISDNTTIGIGAVVIRSIEECGQIWVGVPAKKICYKQIQI